MAARNVSRMGPLADDGGEAGEGLTDLLNRIVRDPERIGSLHEILGPYCHQSRNLLNSLKMSLYLARHHEPRSSCGAWVEVERAYREVEYLYERLQMICRPMPLAYVRLPLSLLLEDRRKTWVGGFAARGRTLELVAPLEPGVGDYDPNYLGQALDAFVSWRGEAGAEGLSASLRWWIGEGKFHLEWVESDPGAEVCPRCGWGRPESLALPLLGRVVSAHGGEMELVKPAGRHVRLSWPQVVRLSL